MEPESPIVEKLRGIHDRGILAVNEGRIKPFVVPEAAFTQFILVNAFSSPTKHLSKLLGTLEMLENPLCVQVTLADRDFLLHATMKQCNLPAGVDADAMEVSSLLAAFASINDHEVVFDTVVLNDGNVLLAASEVPTVVSACRLELDKLIRARGLEPTPIDILHMTLARLITLPGKSLGFALDTYRDTVLELRAMVAEEPIRLKLGNYWHGQVHRLVTTPPVMAYP